MRRIRAAAAETPAGAVIVDDVEGGPVGQKRHGQPGQRGEGRVVIEGPGQLIAGAREKGEGVAFAQQHLLAHVLGALALDNLGAELVVGGFEFGRAPLDAFVKLPIGELQLLSTPPHCLFSEHALGDVERVSEHVRGLARLLRAHVVVHPDALGALSIDDAEQP